MNEVRRRSTELGCFLFAAACMACDAGSRIGPQAGDSTQVGVPASVRLGIGGVALSGHSITMASGGFVRLSVDIADAQGRVVTGARPEFTSRNPKTATVDSVGVVTGALGGVSTVVAQVVAGGRVVADSVNVTVMCAFVFRFGLSFQITDSLTGGPLTRPADVVVQSATFADSVRGLAPGATWETARERPGTYRITVRANGYREWIRGVIVGHDGCNVEPVTVTARLERI